MFKGGMGNLMKQAQQMQEDLKRAQEEVANIEVEGQAGSGMVKVVMTCRNEVRRVSIDDSLMGDDKEMLEDLLVIALNDAVSKAEATSQQRLSGLMPAGMKLPFSSHPRNPTRHAQPARAGTTGRSPTLPAWRRPEVGVAHGLSPAATRPARGRPACYGLEPGIGRRQSLQSLQQLQRTAGLPALCLRKA